MNTWFALDGLMTGSKRSLRSAWPFNVISKRYGCGLAGHVASVSVCRMRATKMCR